jgi:inorganic pyrophosphatase
MLDQDEGDDKIIAVAAKDKSVSHFNDISELPQHLLEQIHRYYVRYQDFSRITRSWKRKRSRS